MKKTIIFDFDYVLFNPKKYIGVVYEKLEYKLNEPGFAKTASDLYIKVRNKGYFDPEDYISQLIANTHGKLSRTDIEEILYDSKLINDCYYPNIEKILKKLQRICSLVIFTTNDQSFFNIKAKKIINLFSSENIYIAKDKMGFVNKLTKYTLSSKTFYIDDILENLFLAKSTNPDIVTVWKKTENYNLKNKTDNFKPDYIVNQIDDLLKIVFLN